MLLAVAMRKEEASAAIQQEFVEPRFQPVRRKTEPLRCRPCDVGNARVPRIAYCELLGIELKRLADLGVDKRPRSLPVRSHSARCCQLLRHGSLQRNPDRAQALDLEPRIGDGQPTRDTVVRRTSCLTDRFGQPLSRHRILGALLSGHRFFSCFPQRCAFHSAMTPTGPQVSDGMTEDLLR